METLRNILGGFVAVLCFAVAMVGWLVLFALGARASCDTRPRIR